MKNWTRPEVSELEVSMTAGGCFSNDIEAFLVYNDKEKRTES